MALPIAAKPMKLAFVEVRYKPAIKLPKSFIKGLPEKIVLFMSIQFHSQYESIKKQLTDDGKTVLTGRPKHAWNEGQLLGCSVEDWSGLGADAFAYIGDGLFHPKALLFKNDIPVHIYDPISKSARTLTRADMEAVLKRRKGALATFHSAKNVGVLITTKYGQNRLEKALELEKKFPDKTFYFLIDDVINFSALEDFPFIEVYINTACPRVMDDAEKIPRPVLNIQDVTDEAW